MTDFESRLRATLVDRANDAPPGEPLAERILTEVSAPVPVLRPRRGWRTWTMPLMAAATVAGVTVAALGLSHLGTSASPKQAPLTHNHSVNPAPKSTVNSSPKPQPTNKTHQTKSTQPVGPPINADPNGVTGFHIYDLSFVGTEYGWAIGTAKCLNGNPGGCTTLFRMTDGAHWTSLGKSLPFTVSARECTDCVDHVRFARPSTGYAYGSGALFMTTDGGVDWTKQPGRGAEALETFNGNVIRLVSNHSGCPGPCGVHAEVAGIGSSTWTRVTLPDTAQTFDYGAFLSRGTDAAYALGDADLASGARQPARKLLVSTDDGASWSAQDSPCASFGTPYTVAVAAGNGQTVTALCVTRSGGHERSFLVVSHDEGTHFARLTGSGYPGELDNELAGDPSTQLLAAASPPRGLIRYDTATARWTSVTAVTGYPSFIGFESQTLGRVVTDGGRIVWTTNDGGQTWSPYRFA